MNSLLTQSVCAIGALTAMSGHAVLAQSEDVRILSEKVVLIDISLAACSQRLSIDGFRFNRLQSAWREVLVAQGVSAQQQYKRVYDSEMLEVLRVMAGDEQGACPYALARVSDLLGNDAPVSERETVQ